MRSVGALSCGVAMLLAIAGCDGGGSMASPDARVTPGGDGGVPMRDGGPLPMSPLVDPECTDGMYAETLPDPSASLADLEAAYDGSAARAFVEAVLGRRYPTGRLLVVNGIDPRIGDCVTRFLRDSSTPAAVYGDMSTVVHECGHFYDLRESTGAAHVYVINDAPLRLTCSGGDASDRGGRTFARSRIRDDAYQALRGDRDFYARVYLDGDPDDATFDGGDQGFDSVLEETLQYVNSLATSYAFTGELMTGGRSSQRDGILTFLWYVMRYLRLARTSFPTAYQHLLEGDGGCWRNAILTVWGRAWLYLETTRGMRHLGIDDAELEGLVMDAELLSEIQRLRDAAGCPAR